MKLNSQKQIERLTKKIEIFQKEIKELENEIEELKYKPVIQIIKEKKLEWGKTHEDRPNWEDAMEWCRKQKNGWRAPTISELAKAYFDGVKGFRAGFYWSSTEGSGPYAYNRSFSSGSESTIIKTYDYSVRCVREIY